MKKRSKPDKVDLEVIRDQILDFACTKHDFKLEKDSFNPNGDWNSAFIIEIKAKPDTDRLFCEAPFGEYFIRFSLELVVDNKIWEMRYKDIIRKISEFDVALFQSPDTGGSEQQNCRLYSRAWIPNFNQRVFGLTFSNLMDCKDAVIIMLSNG